MKRTRLLPYAGVLASLAVAPTVDAQPPTGRHNSASLAAKTLEARAEARARIESAAAASYMRGKQALSGWHAASHREVERDASGRPMLVLSTINRGESLAIAASTNEGGFSSVDLDRAAHLLRAAGGEEHPIDPRTLAFVYRVETHFGVPEIRVVSGYRVPKPGSRSNHGKGRAIDLIVPGIVDEEVAQFAREEGFAGVGVYPTSQFVHVDIRPRSYFWVDSSGPHMKNRERGILADVATRSDAAALARGRQPIEPFVIGTNVDEAMKARGLKADSAASVPDEDEDDEN